MSTGARIALGLAVALVVVAIIAREEREPAEPPAQVCGLAASPACEVEAPPCEAAADRDRNPSDRGVPPRAGLSFREAATAALPYGFNDAAVANGQLTAAEDLELHRFAGSRLIRVVLDWGAVETTPNEFDFADADELYCAAAEAGVLPLYTLTGVPPWALDDPGTCPQPPCVQPPADEHLPAMRRFAELAAIRYPRAAAFEVWNEPNFSAFWPQPDPGRYASMLRDVYVGVKDGNPEMPVLGGAVTNTPNDDPATGTLSMRTFLTGMFDAGAAAYMDGLSVHAYPIGRLGSAEDLLTGKVVEAQSLANAASEDRTIPLWLTETGIPTEEGGFAPAVSEDEQAAELTSIYELLSGSAQVEAVLFHTLVDPTPEIPGGPGFGWFTQPSDGSVEAKPVVCAFRTIAGLDGCPQTVELG